MPMTGSAPNKTYVRSDGTRTGAAVCAQEKSALLNDTAALADNRENDLALGINVMLMKDGGNQLTGDIPANTHKFTGVGSGTASDQWATVGQIQAGSLIYAQAAGTGDAITLDFSPNIVLTAGQVLIFKATATNTGAATAASDGGSAIDIKKGKAGATALVAGDITSGGMYGLFYDGTNHQLLTLSTGNETNVLALNALTGAADKLPYFTSSTAMALADFSAFARTLLDDADAAAMRTTLGSVIGTNVQAFNANLSQLAGLSLVADRLPYADGTGTLALATLTASGRNLLDDASTSAQRTTLGLAIGSDVQAFDADILKADVTDTLTVGYNATEFAAGTKSSGTFTPDPASGNFQSATNGGAHTLAPPASTCSIVIQYTNNGSAGAITTSSFTKVDGAFTTTNGDDFMCYIVRNNGFSHLNIVRMQ